MNAQRLMQLAPACREPEYALDGGAMRALRAHARIYPAGQLICLEGEPSRSIMFMIKGAIGVYQAERLVRVVRGEHLFLGYIAFFGGQKRTATLRAKSDCEILLIPEDKIEATFGIAPTLALRLTRDATALLLDRDNELRQYRKLGAAAQNAMTQKRLAKFVEQAREGAVLKAKVERLLPALLVSLLGNPSKQTVVRMAKELLDTLEPHVDPTALAFDHAAMQAGCADATVGQALTECLDTLVEREQQSQPDRGWTDTAEDDRPITQARKLVRIMLTAD